MRNLLCLPECKREGSDKGGATPSASPVPGGQLPAPVTDSVGQAQDVPSTAVCYLTGQPLSRCLLVILIIYSRSLLCMALYKHAASKLQGCSTLLHNRIGQTDPVSVKGEWRKIYGRRKKEHQHILCNNLSASTGSQNIPRGPTLHNQCLLSAAWSTNPGVILPNSMQNHVR